MRAQGFSRPSPGDTDWTDRLLDALTDVHRNFDAAADPADCFGVLLDSFIELSGARFGLIAEIVGDGRDRPVAVTRAVSVAGSPDDRQWTFGNSMVEILQTLMRRTTRSARPTARQPDDAAGQGALAVPIESRDGLVAVVGLVADGDVVAVRTGAALAPLSAAGARCIGEFRALRRHARVQRRLQASEQRMRAVLDNIVDAIVTVDESGRVETINAAGEQLFGYTPGEIAGKPFARLLPGLDDAPGGLVAAPGADGDRAGTRETQGRRKDGTEFPMALAMTAFEVGRRRLTVAIARDTTAHLESQRLVERERAQNRTLELLIRIDGLTGISNRRHFDEILIDESRRAARDGLPLSLIMCDIDCFKAFNDRYGHVAGDRALTAVAREIDVTFQRAGDTATRYGGEEFAVILAGTDRAQALVMAETMRAHVLGLSIPHGASTVSDRVSVSVGVATCFPEKLFDPQVLVDAADQALYQAKRAGRNRVRG